MRAWGASNMRAAIAIALVAAACGPKATFRLSSDENNAYELGQALSKRKLPASPQPLNTAGEPRAFVLTAGSPKTIVAYSLASGNALWKTDADVQSRIVVGGDFIVTKEGEDIVARGQDNGAARWRVHLDHEFVGAAADQERVYVVTKSSDEAWLTAYDGGDGGKLWSDAAQGSLGAPAAQGGVVYQPFLAQWLAIVDGATGQQLTRLRNEDQQISVLRVTSQQAFYGSKKGLTVLDANSATVGAGASPFAKVKVPDQLERTAYGRDAYDPVQVSYTAADRSRIFLGSASGAAAGYAIHYFRFVLGFEADGTLKWAYSHPRVELVASEHTGHVIVGISSSGDLVALEPSTGAVRARKSLGTTAPVLGATFDADGWSPGEQSEAGDTVAALVSIALDRDARFDRVKELAVTALAKLPGPDVTGQLLAVLSDDRAPQHLKDTVVDLLVMRRDPGSLPVLTAQLGVHTDYIAGTEPEALAAIARAISGLADAPLDPAQVTAALAALQTHLDAATTASDELVHVIGAMSAIGGGAELPALGSHFLLYHSDDTLGGDASWQKAIVTALHTRGGPQERELLRQVAADPRTRPSLATLVQETLGE